MHRSPARRTLAAASAAALLAFAASAPAASAQGPPTTRYVAPPLQNPGGSNPGVYIAPSTEEAQLRNSAWSSSYTTDDGRTVRADVRLNGNSGSYLGGQGRLYNVYYRIAPRNPAAPALGAPLGTISGRWAMNGSGGSFTWTLSEGYRQSGGPNGPLVPGGPPKFSGTWQYDNGGGGVWNGNLTSGWNGGGGGGGWNPPPPRPILGIQGSLLIGTGMRINAVKPGTPAATTGLEVGDVLVSVDGRPLRNSGDFERAMQNVNGYARLGIRDVRTGNILYRSVQLTVPGQQVYTARPNSPTGGRPVNPQPFNPPPQGSPPFNPQPYNPQPQSPQPYYGPPQN